jgi:zinc transport system ATP-binding protein
MSNTLIEFQNVALGYGRKAVLASVNLAIEEGDFLGIVGPNGSGKSTLLKGLLGILKPQSGLIIFKNTNGSLNGRPRFGYVPQRGQLDEIYPLSVAEIVMMGRFAQIGKLRKPKQIDHEKMRESLQHLGITDLAETQYADLSGGLKQRTLIARALVSDPEILVLDEPTDGLDFPSQHAIRKMISHFHSAHNMTVIMVSHHLNEVAAQVKKLALVQSGRLVMGATEEILTEANLSSLYDVPVSVKDFNGQKVILPGGAND